MLFRNPTQHNPLAQNQQNTISPSWHQLDATAAAVRLQVDPATGLSHQEATQRLVEYGKNSIALSRQRSVWQLLLAQFSDFMILVLLAAALVSGVIGDPVDAVVILIIVVLNALIGFVQDYRAEQALHALQKIAASHARVRRAGETVDVPATELVPGDIVLLEAGNVVPADLRLLEAVQLQINEAPLTGESQAVEKNTLAIAEAAHALGDRRNMAFKGCQVNRGRAVGLCVATGMQTEFGKIAALLEAGEDYRTPLQHRMARFGKQLSLLILAVCVLIFFIGLLYGEPWLLMLLTAISLAVAAIPEALPAVITVTLALGAKRMVRENALIRHLPAVEALGSVTFICSDKTGTLTQNRMSLESVVMRDVQSEQVQFTGESWQLLGQALALNNDVIASAHGQWLGDPTELALFEAALRAGFDKQSLQKTLPRVAELSFDSERKRMSTLHEAGDKILMFTKGAPEKVLSFCATQTRGDSSEAIDTAFWEQQAEALAAQGYRVLAVAYRRLAKDVHVALNDALESELTMLGLLALIDPPRPEAQNAVKTCQQAGITPVMITGDHPATALAIARRMGIAGAEAGVITGEQLARLSDADLSAAVLQTRVYARVNPEQKIRIVQALKAKDQFVAMTGDGVNDSPALKSADVGVAMGKIGTEVAREAADLVLLDDDFSTIVSAVREGRRIFDNIRKFIKYNMTGNTGEVLTLFVALLLGLPIPLLPIHILWINLVSDGLPGIALSMEREERQIMQRKPRPFNESIFAFGLWQHMIWMGCLIAALSLLAPVLAQAQDTDHWRTMIFTTLTFTQLMHVMAIRSERDSLFVLGVHTNPALLFTVVFTVLLQLAVVYLPVLQGIFKTQPLSAYELAVCGALTFVVLMAVELEKWMVRRGWIYLGK